jgi:hypothetical protein
MSERRKHHVWEQQEIDQLVSVYKRGTTRPKDIIKLLKWDNKLSVGQVKTKITTLKKSRDGHPPVLQDAPSKFFSLPFLHTIFIV